jgi:hypothetical protein
MLLSWLFSYRGIDEMFILIGIFLIGILVGGIAGIVFLTRAANSINFLK